MEAASAAAAPPSVGTDEHGLKRAISRNMLLLFRRRRRARRRHLRAGRHDRRPRRRGDLGGVPARDRAGVLHRGGLCRARDEVPAGGRRGAVRQQGVRHPPPDLHGRLRGDVLGPHVGGHAVARVAAIALFAVTNGALINMIMASRLLYGMSIQGIVPGIGISIAVMFTKEGDIFLRAGLLLLVGVVFWVMNLAALRARALLYGAARGAAAAAGALTGRTHTQLFVSGPMRSGAAGPN